MPELQVLPCRAGGIPRLAAMAALWVLLAFVGRTVVIGDTALVWPAIGTAVLWFLYRDARALSIDSAVLAACAFGVIYVSGAPVEVALLGMVTNTVQAPVAAALIRRLCPGMRRGGRWAVDTPLVLAGLLVSLLVAVLIGAVLGTTGLLVLGHRVDWLTGALLFGRNLCGALVVTTIGLVVVHRLRPGRPVPRTRRSAARWLELGAAAGLTAGTYALVFSLDSLPLMFPLLVTTVWFGARFGVVANSWHTFIVGSSVVALTLAHLGPFAEVSNPRLGSLLAQAFVITLFLTGMALATGREENRALTAALRLTEKDAVYQAQLLQTIVGSINEGITVIDGAGRIHFRNAAADQFLHRSVEGRADPDHLMTGGSFIVDGRQVPLEERPSARALRGETVQDLEVMVRENGEEWIMSMSASPLPPDDHTDEARAVLLFRDATSEHARRVELSTFAGVVAHDLRNPLAAITGWTEMIAEDLEVGEVDPAVLHQFIDRIRSSSTRMGELITDLLGYATSKDRELSVSQVDVTRLVRDVAAARAADGLVRTGPIPPVDADPVLLRQVVDNLVGNALKYVAPGTRPDVRVTGRIVDKGIVAISVADNGIGLPAGQHEKVFGEFHRAHHRQYDGHGLGLAICRRIVLRHGGAIVAYDNPTGTGTVFEFRLPSAVAALQQEIEQVFDGVGSSPHGGRMEQAG